MSTWIRCCFFFYLGHCSKKRSSSRFSLSQLLRSAVRRAKGAPVVGGWRTCSLCRARSEACDDGRARHCHTSRDCVRHPATAAIGRHRAWNIHCLDIYCIQVMYCRYIYIYVLMCIYIYIYSHIPCQGGFDGLDYAKYSHSAVVGHIAPPFRRGRHGRHGTRNSRPWGFAMADAVRNLRQRPQQGPECIRSERGQPILGVSYIWHAPLEGSCSTRKPCNLEVFSQGSDSMPNAARHTTLSTTPLRPVLSTLVTGEMQDEGVAA